MKNFKKATANALEKIFLTSAKSTCNATSFLGAYQPKEPANLKDRIAKIEKK
ncbi:MAG: cyclic lactone autoinducer peptide [Oscillospiraceae bacterium]|jgi:cyclic lactone autoinducer peptide|nr:cyclic lactone autoinducer peptide [Oscillospiraceae bacterium]